MYEIQENITNIFDVKGLMPDYTEIPPEFKNRNNKWVRIASMWFFKGLPADTKFIPKSGVDTDKALKHVATIQRSFQPKHEHKEAACAFLLAEWFEDITF